MKWLRVTLCLIICAFLSVIFYYSFNFLFEDFPIRPIKTLPWHVGFVGLLFRGIIIGGIMYPIAKYFVKQQQVMNEKIQLERLNRRNILSHLGFLQQQMDNQFMLNSLHILGSGIEEEWGKNYIKRLCNVYSYLVDGTHGENIITVKKEVEFIESYNHLLKMRFEDSIKLKINLNNRLLSRKIPPMSLQTLVENAVKHNVVSPHFPLHIEIFNDKNNIIVRNNVQLKFPGIQKPDVRTGVGLQNLRDRYRILAKTSVVVRNDENHYDVTISTI